MDTFKRDFYQIIDGAVKDLYRSHKRMNARWFRVRWLVDKQMPRKDQEKLLDRLMKLKSLVRKVDRMFEKYDAITGQAERE